MLRRIAVLLAVPALLLAPPRPAAADDTVRVVAAFPGGIEVFENVAKYAGLYKAEHLDVDKEYAGSASACAQLVATGKADICAASMEPTILGYDKGIRMQTFFSRVNRFSYEIVVLDDSPIRTLADFKGQVVGESSPGDTTEVVGTSILAGAGLKKGDYSFAPVGAGAQAIAALAEHRVAGLSTVASDVIPQAALAGIKIRQFRSPVLEGVQNSGFASTPATIAAKGDLLGRYARAIAKAAVLMYENPELAAKYQLTALHNGAPLDPAAVKRDADTLRSMGDFYTGSDPMSTRIGYLSPISTKLYCRFFYDAGLTKTLVPASDVMTDQFIAFANDFDHKAWIAEVKRMR
jgi:NitT/TauT family transport system substrate-binding protein